MAGKYRRQASALSLVRYGPELSALTALLRQAQQTRNESISSARTGAASIQSAVDLARPDARRVYSGAQKIANAQNAITAPSLASLPAGNPFSAAASIEQSGLQSRLAESRASTLSELDERRVGAAAGYASERRQANRELRKTGQQVGQRYQDLARERGAFEASTITDLRGAAAKSRADTQELVARLTQQERNSLRSAGTDPDTLKPIPFGPQDPKAPKNQPKATKKPAPATTHQQQDASKQIGQAVAALGNLDPDKDPGNWGALGNLLLSGQEAKPIHDPATGKPKYTKTGVPLMTPKVPQIDRVYARAALQMYYNGHVDRSVVRDLHKLRLTIRDIPGVITEREWRQDPVAQARYREAEKARRRAAGQPDWVRKIGAALNAR
jgi:hypothetical protein